ncbi:MAG: GH25 family lysozyme, partial [Candidatus Hodarchaeota archaeon]
EYMKVREILIIILVYLPLTVFFVGSVFVRSPESDSFVDGIDVSHWQGTINWSQVYGGGYRFAFCKASEGTSYTDSTFTTNMNGGTTAGLYMGPYHYARPDVYSATAEATHFVSVIDDYMIDGYMRPALDLEEGTSLGKTALTDWVINFMTYVEDQTGVEPIIYCNSNYANNYLDSRVTQYDLWIANWDVQTPNTGVWDTWAFWQYTVSDAGYVPGISGRADLDYYNGDLSSLEQNFVIGDGGSSQQTYKGHTYELFSSLKTWDQAKTDCESQGGHLVSITTSGENEFVSNLAGSNKVWIGLTDEISEGNWGWITEENVDYTNWSSGEPNDYGSGEDYGEMLSDGSWNDNGPPEWTSITRYYVCEWDGTYNTNVYSPTGATSYAEYWWDKRNPHYYDYSNVGGDCANFVSQCLIAGGLSLWKGTNNAGGGLDQYGTLPSCDNLNSHLQNYQIISHERCVKSDSWDDELPSWVEPGTVLQYGTAGGDEYRHAVIVTGGNGDSATVTGHTSDEHGWSWTAFSSFTVVHAYKPSGYTSDYNVVEITATHLNVRTGPSTNYGILTTIQNGEEYVSFDSYNGWYLFWLDERCAWISGSYVNVHSLSNYNCYRVITETLNVRSGPGIENEIVGRCHYGQCFVRYGISGSWYQIYYSSDTEWVHSDYLSPMGENPPPIPEFHYTKYFFLFLALDFLTLALVFKKIMQINFRISNTT